MEVVDGLFNCRKMLGRPGEREDYQEINSKTGLALLTSQGSAVQCPMGLAANTGWYYCGFSVKKTQRGRRGKK